MSTTSRVRPAALRRGGEALGGLLVGASALQFGTIVLFGKLSLRADIPVFDLLAARFAIAAALLVPVLALLRRPLLPAPGERVGIVIVGMAGYGVEAMFFFAALRHGTAAAVTLLFFTYPVSVTLTTWAMGRGRPNRLTVLSLASAVAGAALVVGTGAGLAVSTVGVVLALMSALTYTGYLIGADHVLKRTNALTAAAWQAGAASVGLATVGAVDGGLQLPTGWGEWWPLLGMALATSAAFFCLLEGLQRLGAVRTAIISSLEPFAAAVLGFVFLNEAVGIGVAAGGVLIVIGAIAAALARAAPMVEPPLP